MSLNSAGATLNSFVIPKFGRDRRGGCDLASSSSIGVVTNVTWSAAPSLNSGYGTVPSAIGFGNANAAAVAWMANLSAYNGVSWSADVTIPVMSIITDPYISYAGCGSSTALLLTGGEDQNDNIHNSTFFYNGVSWFTINNMLSAVFEHACCGSVGAALVSGGYLNSSGTSVSSGSETFNGSNWVVSGNMTAKLRGHFICGSSSSALEFGGYNYSVGTITGLSQIYNGFTWSNTNTLNTARDYPAGAGILAACIAYGGTANTPGSGVLSSTELYSSVSSVWATMSASLITSRCEHGGCGSVYGGLAIGGTNNGTSGLSSVEIFAPVYTYTPSARFSGNPLSGNAALSVQFTDHSTNAPTSWLWHFGDGGTSTSQSPQHTYNNSGYFTVWMTATNVAGSNTTTETNYVTVSPGANFTATPLSGNAPLAVQFTDTSAGSPTSWLWTFGDGGTSTVQSPQYTYVTAGTYSVSLKVSNSIGSSTDTQPNYISATHLSVWSMKKSIGLQYSFGPITVLDNGTFLAIASYTSSQLWKSTDGGNTWVESISSFSSYIIRCICDLGSGVVLFGDSNGHLWESTDYGSTASDIGQVGLCNTITCLVNMGSGTVVAGGNDASLNGYVYQSTNSGASWTLAYTPGVFNPPVSLCNLGNSTVYLACGTGNIFESTSNGAPTTWSSIGSIGSTIQVYQVIYIGSSTLLASERVFSAYGVYVSTDNGLTWTLYASIPGFSVMTEINGLATAGGFTGGSNALVYTSTNGVTYSLSGTLDASASVTGLAATSTGVIVAGTSSGNIWVYR